MNPGIVSIVTAILAVCGLFVAAAVVGAGEARGKSADGEGRYASVNGVTMYYEVHGAGKPLVVLHGAFGWANVFPALAANRRVIAVELQGHGHTPNNDRPMTFENMADDVAELLKQLGIERADLFGYSMGGTVALAVAIRHPDVVGKVVLTGSHYGKGAEAFERETIIQMGSLPADFAPPILKDHYDEVAPDPKQWPALVANVKKLQREFEGFSREQMQSIKAAVLITQGDHDGVRPEHAVAMFRLIPHSQLAILPNADHFLIFQHPERLLPTVVSFLDSAEKEPPTK